ncbi:MAG: hypothetical protein ACOCVM_00055 [Desulfovibrionaceae bacterium]
MRRPAPKIFFAPLLLGACLWFGASGCATMLAAQGAATAAMALSGATAMELTANDMMPRQHEEMEAHLDAFFKQGPIVPGAKTAARRPRLVDPEELFPGEGPQDLFAPFPARPRSAAGAESLPVFPDSGQPAAAPAQAESQTPDLPVRPASDSTAPRTAASAAPDATPSPSRSSYMEEYQAFFGVWPLEGAPGSLEGLQGGDEAPATPAAD